MSKVGCTILSRAELRRCNIKEVARQLFVEHGFHSTGIALIAKESGVAVQQLYRDFPAKEDIIALIVEEDCRRFADLATLNTALLAKDKERIKDWLTSAPCRKDEDADRLFLEIAAEASRNDRIKRIFADVGQVMLDNISRAFCGLFGDPAVSSKHQLLAEAFMVISAGSVFARTLHQRPDNGPSAKLVDCLISEAFRSS